MTGRNHHHLSSLLGLAVLLALLSATPVVGQPGSLEVPQDDEPGSEKDPNIQRLKLKLTLEAVYDDNIGNLRGEARDEFLSGDFDADRFLLDSVDDTVFEPELVLTYSSSPASGKTNAFGGGFSLVRPSSNDVLHYERYFVFFSKDLTDVRPEIRDLELEAEELRPAAFQLRRKFLTVNRSQFKLGYYRIDDRYAGQLRDVQSGGRSSAHYNADVYELRHRQRLNRGEQNRAQLVLRYLREERDYTAEFNERDSTADRFLIGLNLAHLQKKSFLLLEGYYEFMEVSSDTSLTGSSGLAGTRQTDLASDRDLVGLRLGVNWYRSIGGIPMRRANRARFGVVWAARDFTTDNVLDRSHFGREDEGLYYTFDFTFAVEDDLGIFFWIKYLDQDTNRLIDSRPTTSTFEEVLYGIGFTFQAGRRFRSDRSDRQSRLPRGSEATPRPPDIEAPAEAPAEGGSARPEGRKPQGDDAAHAEGGPPRAFS